MTVATMPLPATYSRRDERGTFVEVIDRGSWEAVITGSMKAGAVLGNHYHKMTELFFFLVEGRCRMDGECVETGRRWAVRLEAGQGIHIGTYDAHAVRFEEPSRFILLKSRAFDPDLPDLYDHTVQRDPC